MLRLTEHEGPSNESELFVFAGFRGQPPNDGMLPT